MPVIFVSIGLVLVGTVTLVIGFFNDQQPGFIYATIVTSLLAGAFLVFELLRQRPSQKPVLATGSERHGARAWDERSSWSSGRGGTTTLEPDDAEFGGLEASYDDELDGLDVGKSPSLYDYDALAELEAVDQPQGEGATWWAPEAAGDDEPLQTTRFPDLQNGWDADRVSWQEREPELTRQSRPQPVAEHAHTSADREDREDRERERFLAALAPVRGVGPSKQAELFAHFRTLRRLRNADVDRLAEIPGISTTLALRIYNQLHR